MATASTTRKRTSAKTGAVKKAPTKRTASATKKAPARKKAPAKAAATKTVAKKRVPAAARARGTSKSSAAKAAAPKKTPAKAAATRKAATKKPAPAQAAAKKAPATKARAKSPFDAKFLDQQRVLLLEERETYLRQAVSLQAEADQLAAEREPGDVQFDEESGEGDTLAVERERDLALSARARHEVSEIDLALEKINAKTYGVCEVSGKAIPKERLRAIPQARVRVEYKTGGFGQRT